MVLFPALFEVHMIYRKLGNDTVELYLEYLRHAIAVEPDEMWVECVDEDGIRQRINDPFYSGTTSILAIEDGKAVGRIEYHFYGCIQDGYRMAYVDWVYVLPEYRSRGIARGLFAEFERECAGHRIDQYFLIRSENESAARFYGRFPGAELSSEPVLRKNISK